MRAALHDVAGGRERRDGAGVVVVQVGQDDVVDVLGPDAERREPVERRAVERDPVDRRGPGRVEAGVDEDGVLGADREPHAVRGGVRLLGALVVTEEVLAAHAGPAREADRVDRERAHGAAAAVARVSAAGVPRSSVGVR
jgi:hypothetical protein